MPFSKNRKRWSSFFAVNALGPRTVYPSGVIEICVCCHYAAFEIPGAQLEGGDFFIEGGVVKAVVVVINGVEFGGC